MLRSASGSRAPNAASSARAATLDALHLQQPQSGASHAGQTLSRSPLFHLDLEARGLHATGSNAPRMKSEHGAGAHASQSNAPSASASAAGDAASEAAAAAGSSQINPMLVAAALRVGISAAGSSPHGGSSAVSHSGSAVQATPAAARVLAGAASQRSNSHHERSLFAPHQSRCTEATAAGDVELVTLGSYDIGRGVGLAIDARAGSAHAFAAFGLTEAARPPEEDAFGEVPITLSDSGAARRYRQGTHTPPYPYGAGGSAMRRSGAGRTVSASRGMRR